MKATRFRNVLLLNKYSIEIFHLNIESLLINKLSHLIYVSIKQYLLFGKAYWISIDDSTAGHYHMHAEIACYTAVRVASKR